MIVAAAVRVRDGSIFSVPKPGRHSDVFLEIARRINYDITDKLPPEPERLRWREFMHGHVSGFVTDTGEFLDRDQAWEHVVACKQPLTPYRTRSWNGARVPDDEIIGGVLTSEDLW